MTLRLTSSSYYGIFYFSLDVCYSACCSRCKRGTHHTKKTHRLKQAIKAVRFAIIDLTNEIAFPRSVTFHFIHVSPCVNSPTVAMMASVSTLWDDKSIAHDSPREPIVTKTRLPCLADAASKPQCWLDPISENLAIRGGEGGREGEGRFSLYEVLLL